MSLLDVFLIILTIVGIILAATFLVGFYSDLKEIGLFG